MAWTAGVIAILHSAVLVGKARADCTDEEYTLVIEGLPFGARMAQMLVKISRDLRLTKHVSVLPSDTLTLYHLTRLSDQRFGKLIENGTISPSMKRNEASAETRKERKEADERRILSVEPAPGKKRALIIDPPWDYEWLSIAGPPAGLGACRSPPRWPARYAPAPLA